MEVSDLAKDIVKKWKNDVDEDKKRKRTLSLSHIGAQSLHILALVAALKAPPKRSGPRTVQTDGVQFSTLGDGTRDKCRTLIYDALAIDSGAREHLHYLSFCISMSL